MAKIIFCLLRPKKINYPFIRVKCHSLLYHKKVYSALTATAQCQAEHTCHSVPRLINFQLINPAFNYPLMQASASYDREWYSVVLFC